MKSVQRKNMKPMEALIGSYFAKEIEFDKVRGELQLLLGENWKNVLYDSDVAICRLTRINLIAVLTKYLNSDIDEKQLIDWASHAIVWDVVDFDPADEELISDILSDIDNMREDGWNLTRDDLRKYVMYLETIPDPRLCSEVIEKWVAAKAAQRQLRHR